MKKLYDAPQPGTLIYVTHSGKIEDAIGPFLVINIIHPNTQVPKDDYLYQILTQVIYLCHAGNVKKCSLSKVFIGERGDEIPVEKNNQKNIK